LTDNDVKNETKKIENLKDLSKKIFCMYTLYS